MTAKDFYLILIESLLHEARQTYFNAKREQFKCNPDEYFTGLMNSFKRLNDEVNKTDYLSAIVTTPEGEEREYHLSSDSSSEQTIFLGTIGKVSFPKKRTIDLRSFTDGKFTGYLTAELMAGLWPDLHKYFQSIIDEKTKTIQELTGTDEQMSLVNELQEDVTKYCQLVTEFINTPEPMRFIIKFDDFKVQSIYDCVQEAIVCDYLTFRNGIETANFKDWNIKRQNFIQEVTYRLTEQMGEIWYAEICKNMNWKKSTVSGQGKKMEDDPYIKRLNRILPRPKK